MSTDPKHAVELNRRHWNAVARIHESEGTHARKLRAGATNLSPIELSELAPLVPGRSLVHLQCHSGADTISLFRLGATDVVGVDFSADALELARGFARELNVAVEFVESDVVDAAARLGRTFDIVYASHGALCWLPDIEPWADNVVRLLAPGGFVYLVEFHPFVWSLADDTTAERPTMGYRYLPHEEPNYFADQDDYLDPSKKTPPFYTWNHGLGAVVTSLTARGLVLEYLHEFPYCAGTIVPALKPRPDGYFELPGTDGFPLSYSLLARRPAIQK